MSVRNLHWYNQNETRWYPLAEFASATSQRKQLLPSNIIADLNMRYPDYLGVYPFIASVCVTANLISVTIQASHSLDDVTSFAPVAAISLPMPVIPFIHYPIQGMVPGVGGWIVFGDGIQESFTGQFAGPKAGLLSPRAARAYKPLPVQSLAKISMTPLTGLVLLKAEQPLQIASEPREIEGALRDTIVFRLVQPGGDPNVVGQGAETNVFQEFAGSCGVRPESGTCGNPAPLQFLNAVPPDCNGNINIVLKGCAQIGNVVSASGNGVVVDCALSLADACNENELPDETGKLPNDYPDLCIATSETASESAGETSSDIVHQSDSVSSANDQPIVTGALPYSETFDELTSDAENWVTISGQWKYVADDSPGDIVHAGQQHSSYTTENNLGATQRNVAIWEGFDHMPLARRYTTELKMLAGPGNGNRNGGIILNYRPHPTYPGRFVYYLISLDYDAQQLQILRFNGTNLVPEPAFADLPGLTLDDWYKLVVDVTPDTGINVDITVTLSTLTGSSAITASMTLTTAAYLPAVGYCGLHVNRGFTRFGYFQVEEL